MSRISCLLVEDEGDDEWHLVPTLLTVDDNESGVLSSQQGSEPIDDEMESKT